MNKFESELKAGNFVTSECSHCHRIVWPPSNYCDNCFNEVNWRKVSPNGTIIELSKKENTIFCIAEFEDKIRIIGKLDAKIHTAKPGQSVKFNKCSLNGTSSFFFSLEN
tara:strand:+ start:533 stop:859 length:327 start_codon:yes stop_codon:yes gene_type:complete